MQKLSEIEKNSCGWTCGSCQQNGGSACWPLPPTLSVLHLTRRDGVGRAGQGHPGVGIDDWNDFAGASSRWLLEARLIIVTSHP